MAVVEVYPEEEKGLTCFLTGSGQTFLTINFCEMKGSLIIVGFFILGIAAGLSGMVPESIIDGDLTFYALCALLLCVGIGIGSDRNIVTKFKSLDVRMALLPLGTALGTFAGSLAVSLILSGRSPLDCLAVGSGFGYYSLSSIFITEYKGAELGTIALLANIIREMVTLLLSRSEERR